MNITTEELFKKLPKDILKDILDHSFKIENDRMISASIEALMNVGEPYIVTEKIDREFEKLNVNKQFMIARLLKKYSHGKNTFLFNYATYLLENPTQMIRFSTWLEKELL